MTTFIEILQSLKADEDADVAYLFAATLNLYSEALRRRAGRIMYGPTDVKAVLDIVNTLLACNELTQEYVSTRSIVPSKEEAQAVMEADLGEVLP